MADNPAWANKPKSPGYPTKQKLRGHARARVISLRKVLDNMQIRDNKNELVKQAKGSFKEIPYFDALDTATLDAFIQLRDHCDYLLSRK